MALNDLACPKCHVAGKRTAAQHHPASPDPANVAIRRYTCGSCGEAYDTQERAVQLRASDLRVRDRTGSDRLYNRDDLNRSLARFIPKALLDREYAAVVASVEEKITSAHTQPGAVIPIQDMANYVQQGLKSLGRDRRSETLTAARQRYLAAYVQYTLAVGPPGREFKTVQEILGWMHKDSAFRSLGLVEDPRPPAWTRTSTTWHMPQSEPPTPIVTVLKNSYVERTMEQPRRRERDSYREDKIRSRLDRAFRKLPTYEGGPEDLIAYLRWGLAGQQVVRTSQISTILVEALRSTSDVAYLRWVAIGKELSVTELHAEAQSLIRYPSPQLVFSRDTSRPALRLGRPVTRDP